MHTPQKHTMQKVPKRCEKQGTIKTRSNQGASIKGLSSACVAQWIRRTPPKGEIVGSSPTVGYDVKVLLLAFDACERA